MVETPSRSEVGFAALAGATGILGSYALAGYTRSFVVAPIDALVVRLTPGQIVAFMIERVGEPAHLLHVALAVLLAGGLYGTVALVGIVAGRRRDWPIAGVAFAGLASWAATVAITGEPALAVGAAVPVAVATGLGAASPAPAGHDPDRRRVILAGAGLVGLGSVAASVGRTLLEGDDGGGTGSTDGADETGVIGADADGGVTSYLDRASEQELAIAGEDVPGLVSPIGEFYNVDIAQFDPELDAEDWSLSLTGEVGEDVTVTFDELTDMPTEHRYVTLRCVGEGLNGRKLDNAVWTGTPIKPLLDRADPEGACGCAMLHAEDGYFVQFPVAALEDGFLAWGMNGKPLPQSHGRPVRVLVPGHWGETNVKWLEEIELLDEETDGYWEQRGWHGTGPVNTVAKLWDDTALENGNVEVAGHAYAGTRGIERVEVSVDGGDTWTDAQLSEPLPGEDVWRQWRHEFATDGSHEVVVRAVDGTGQRQPREESDAFPSGASGWVRETIDA